MLKLILASIFAFVVVKASPVPVLSVPRILPVVNSTSGSSLGSRPVFGPSLGSSVMAETVYNKTYPLTAPVKSSDGSVEFRIAIIADQDKLSKDKRDTSSFVSYLKSGTFTIKSEWVGGAIVWDTKTAASNGTTEEKDKLTVGNGQAIASQFAFGSRGMELSDLIVFNGKLYACDDRTGIIFQLVDHQAVPWVILSDGNGMKQKGIAIKLKIIVCPNKDELTNSFCVSFIDSWTFLEAVSVLWSNAIQRRTPTFIYSYIHELR